MGENPASELTPSPLYEYTSVPGVFLQDDAATDPDKFDFVRLKMKQLSRF
jgi:hypothetical protein